MKLRNILGSISILSYGLITPALAEIPFEDVAVSAGVAMTSANVESLAWGDYDNDGDQDVYLTVDGNNAFMRNNDDGTFTDIIASNGTQDSGWSVGTAFADFDNDGDLDLFVVNFGADADSLFRNDGASSGFSFSNVANAAGLTANISSSRGVTLIDYNRDGLVDIYINAIGPNLLYKNEGDLMFTEVANSAGVGADDTGVGTVMSDIDNNAWPDLFTGNRSNNPNRLYLNSKTGFSDATSSGIDKEGLGMGVVAFDYDNDLDIDLYWTSWPGMGATPTNNALYDNQNGVFVDLAVASGTADPLGWGISANVADADNDGWLDLLVSNGFSPSSGPNLLFQNLGASGSKTFSSQDMGSFDGRGVAWADYDNDGDMDLLITGGAGQANRLYNNTSTLSLNQWLQINLLGRISNASAIGARVVVNSNQGSFVQEVSGGAGRGSQNSLPLEFGLGPATQIQSIDVRWPNGNQQSYNYSGALNRRIDIIEDQIFTSKFEDLLTERPSANIASVSVSGVSGNYSFSVGILSVETGCDQYADWWEVLDINGLVHRRILTHSHILEQPFVRTSITPVTITSNQQVWIRAHMNNGGFGGTMFTGSVANGFAAIPYSNNWTDAVEFAIPQIESCAF